MIEAAGDTFALFDRVRTEVKIRSKRIWLVLAALLSLGAVAVAIWSASPRAAPQFVTLSDGVKYRFTGVTWGTNHINPGDSLAARVTDHLPDRWAAYIRAKYGTKFGLSVPYRTAEPSLCVWLKPGGTNLPPAPPAGRIVMASAVLADDNSIEAGLVSRQILPFAGMSPQPTAVFYSVPRRSRYLECCFYYQAANGGGFGGGGFVNNVSPPPVAAGSIRFPNPLYGRYPKWRPEPLPASKPAGDLEVRLTNCFTGIFVNAWDPETRTMTNAYRPAKPGEAAATEFGLLMKPASGTNEAWIPQSIESSDATGNRLTGNIWQWAPPGVGLWLSRPPAHGRYRVEGTLWPDEPALRLRLDLKRVSGWPPGDLTTFSNLPINTPNAANGTTLTNVIHGIPIVLRNFSQQVFSDGPMPGPYCVEIELPGPQSGVAVDFVEIITATGEKPGPGGSREDSKSRNINFNTLPAGAKSLNVTLAVQKLRTVEFFVKPVKLGEGENRR